MTTTNIDLPARTTALRTILTAALAIVAAAATTIYGAYGDPTDNTAQEKDVPVTIGAGVVVAALLFGLLVPWASRRASRAAGWGLTAGILALVTFPIAFWSGVPLLFAATGGLLGVTARRSGSGGRMARFAVVLSAAAAALSTVLLILGNTVLAQ